MGKQSAPYSENGRLFSNKNEQTTDTRYNTDKLQKHQVTGKNPDAKRLLTI